MCDVCVRLFGDRKSVAVGEGNEIGPISEVARRAKDGCCLCQFFQTQCCKGMEGQEAVLTGGEEPEARSFEGITNRLTDFVESLRTLKTFIISAGAIAFIALCLGSWLSRTASALDLVLLTMS